MSVFFITGMPRSRTTWLANLFTYGGSYCIHDGLQPGSTVEDLSRRFSDILIHNPHVGHIGDSDSGLLLHARDVVEQFPDARWLFVKRGKDQCEASYRKHFADYDPYLPEGVDVGQVFDICQGRYVSAILAVPRDDRMEIDVAELDNLGNLRRIWEWLTPGEPFCEDRAKMLDRFQLNPYAKKLPSLYSK